MRVSQQKIDSEKERIRREKSREMSKRVAAFLADFNDDAIAEGFTGQFSAKATLAVAPVVMDMAMKGIFK